MRSPITEMISPPGDANSRNRDAEEIDDRRAQKKERGQETEGVEAGREVPADCVLLVETGVSDRNNGAVLNGFMIGNNVPIVSATASPSMSVLLLHYSTKVSKARVPARG